MTLIIWTVAFLVVIAIGCCTIWLPLMLLGAAASGPEGEGEIKLETLLIETPMKRGLARVRTLLRLSRDPLLGHESTGLKQRR